MSDPLSVRLEARALDALADALAGPPLVDPVTVAREIAGMEARVTVGPPVRQTPPAEPSPAALVAALDHCFLADEEVAILAVLVECGHCLTLYGLLERAEERLDEELCQGPLRHLLGRFVRVGVLMNDRKGRPPGYQLTPEFRAHLRRIATCTL